jgi:hypothetical protein
VPVFAARRAGSQHASNATITNNNATPAKFSLGYCDLHYVQSVITLPNTICRKFPVCAPSAMARQAPVSAGCPENFIRKSHLKIIGYQGIESIYVAGVAG